MAAEASKSGSSSSVSPDETKKPEEEGSRHAAFLLYACFGIAVTAAIISKAALRFPAPTSGGAQYTLSMQIGMTVAAFSCLSLIMQCGLAVVLLNFSLREHANFCAAASNAILVVIMGSFALLSLPLRWQEAGLVLFFFLLNVIISLFQVLRRKKAKQDLEKTEKMRNETLYEIELTSQMISAGIHRAPDHPVLAQIFRDMVVSMGGTVREVSSRGAGN